MRHVLVLFIVVVGLNLPTTTTSSPSSTTTTISTTTTKSSSPTTTSSTTTTTKSSLFGQGKNHITVCGDDSARHLFWTIVGLENQTAPLFVHALDNWNVPLSDVVLHFRWVGVSNDYRNCLVRKLNFPTKWIVVSFGLYDVIQEVPLEIFAQHLDNFFLSLKKESDFSMPNVLVRTITLDQSIFVRQVMNLGDSLSERIKPYNEKVRELFTSHSSSVMAMKNRSTWVLFDAESLYQDIGIYKSSNSNKWLEVRAADASQVSTLMSELSLVSSALKKRESWGKGEEKKSFSGQEKEVWYTTTTQTPVSSKGEDAELDRPKTTMIGRSLREGFFLSVGFSVVVLVLGYGMLFFEKGKIDLFGISVGEEKSEDGGQHATIKGGSGKDEGAELRDDEEMMKNSKKERRVLDSLMATRGTGGTDALNALRCWVILGLILLTCFLLDNQHIFPPMEKTFNGDFFAFLTLVMALFGGFSVQEAKVAKGHCGMLNRDQTEEWRGWMQISFLLYHYYNAKPVYNLIRVFVASYVWMTGFGHFSYFWVRKDWSLIRFVKSLFRMNFLVVLILFVMETDYVHYYICPMHTFFFFLVWGITYIFRSQNTNPYVMIPKLLLAFAICEILWTVTPLFDFVFRAFPFLKENGSFHEWQFRSGLDRFVTAYGMVFAYYYPSMENILFSIDAMSFLRGNIAKGVLFFGSGGILYAWWHYIGGIEDKFEYNRYHPYTSWIPITFFIFLRNSWGPSRKVYMWGFGWLGKITLETYLLQFHLMLQNFNKKIVNFLPEYPNLNFLVTWALLLLASQHAFTCTVALSEYFLPYSLNSSQKVLSRLVVISIFLLSFIFLGVCCVFLGDEIGFFGAFFFFLLLLGVGVWVILGLPSRFLQLLSFWWNYAERV